MQTRILETVGSGPKIRPQGELRRLGLPLPRLGASALHRSDRSALVRKAPAWYSPMVPSAPDDLPVWPDP